MKRSTRGEATNDGRRRLVGFAMLAMALVFVFVIGWVLGHQGQSPISATIDYPQAELPDERYAITVPVDASFYSFYREFDRTAANHDSVAGRD